MVLEVLHFIDISHILQCLCNVLSVFRNHSNSKSHLKVLYESKEQTCMCDFGKYVPWVGPAPLGLLALDGDQKTRGCPPPGSLWTGAMQGAGSRAARSLGTFFSGSEGHVFLLTAEPWLCWVCGDI